MLLKPGWKSELFLAVLKGKQGVENGGQVIKGNSRNYQ